jgi:serine/threonine-protein kinase
MPEQEIRLAAPLGSVVAERYRLEAIIGVGGMGIVVAATHVQLEQQVAIKFLQAEAAGSADVVARFMREARAELRRTEETRSRLRQILRGANSSSRDGSTVSQWGGTSRALQGSSRRKAAIVAVGVTGLALAGVVGFSVVRGNAVPPSPTTFDHGPGSSGAQSQETTGLSGLAPPASENATLPSADINEPAFAAPSSLRGELSAVSPRSNASEKVSKGAKARMGGASKLAPAASSARTPVPQKGASDRWEDER